MLASLLAVAVATLAPFVSATLVITKPTSAGWPGNTTVQIAWTFGQDDPNFSIELNNDNIKTGLLSQGPLAVGNNIVPNTQVFNFGLPTVPPADDYYITFVAIDNINTVYAKSGKFPITDNPQSSSIPVSTPTNTPSTTTGRSTTVTRNSTTTTTPSTSTKAHNSTITSTSSSEFTSLSITTNSPSSTTTTKSGGATRMEVAWYVGAVGAFLGAIFA